MKAMTRAPWLRRARGSEVDAHKTREGRRPASNGGTVHRRRGPDQPAQDMHLKQMHPADAATPGVDRQRDEATATATTREPAREPGCGDSTTGVRGRDPHSRMSINGH